VLCGIAEQLSYLRKLVLRYLVDMELEYYTLAALASRGTLAVLELQPD
jgi:hypothetical protein